MANRRKKKKVVNVGDRKYGLYNFNFPKSIQPKDITSASAEIDSIDSVQAELENVKSPVTIKPDIKGEVMAEEHVERFITDDGREAVKITSNKVNYHSNTKVVEVFEDKVTPHVLTKRITEYTKPVVFKIKTELVDENGNVVEVIIEELDEKSDDFKMSSTKEIVEPEIKAQSVAVREPVVRHVKKSFTDMRSLSLERNRNTSTNHKVNKCGDCGGVIQ